MSKPQHTDEMLALPDVPSKSAHAERGIMPTQPFKMGERARYVRQAWQSLGYPPTAEDVSHFSPYGDRYFSKSTGELWDNVLRQAGVPGRDTVVAKECRRLYRDRYPWQAFVRIHSTGISKLTDIAPGHVGRLLYLLATGKRSVGPMDDITLVLENPGGTNKRHWRVAGPDHETEIEGAMTSP